MFLGRRKSGFTEEEIVRPDEIPDIVNEENDRTFARPKSACMGHAEPIEESPAEWVPPPPMPMHRLLREFIRSQCELAQVTSRSQLVSDDPGAEALLEQIEADPECADIQQLQGQNGLYYYSSEKMSRFVAWVTVLVLENDLPFTIAELTRYNCVTYPAPTLVEYFSMSPFRYSQQEIDEALKVVFSDSRYQDIHQFLSAQGRPYLYSSDKMSEKYAYALSENLDRSTTE